MTALEWLPEELHPVAVRLARADDLAFELAEVALAWSRGPDDNGPLSLRQVERRPGYLNLEITAIRPVPPIAAALFSEAVHHLRSALDNVVFHLIEAQHPSPLSAEQARLVSMLIYDEQGPFDRKIIQLVKRGLTEFGSTLGRRIASLQPFADGASVPAISPPLARMMGATPARAHPLALLRDYSNEDKHRTIRLAAGRSLVQRPDEWPRGLGLGMRHIEVGTVLAEVAKRVPTEIETSPALHVQRPDGVWVAPGFELDCLARHVADVALPTLITGLALPGSLPAQVDLGDTAESLTERLRNGGSQRAHDRAREVAAQAYAETMTRDARFPPIVADGDLGH